MCIRDSHVGGHTPADLHGLELFDVLTPVEHGMPALVAGHGRQYGGKAVDGVASGARAGGVGPNTGQADEDPQRPLTARLDDAGGSLAEDGGVGLE